MGKDNKIKLERTAVRLYSKPFSKWWPFKLKIKRFWEKHMNLADILERNGYDINNYVVDVKVLSENNQVIIIKDMLRAKLIEQPIEDNVLAWSNYKLARTLCDMLDLDQ